jgi:hypothetical protein
MATARLSGQVDANDIQRIVDRGDIWELTTRNYNMFPCTLIDEGSEACRANTGRLRVRVITLTYGFVGPILPLLELANPNLLQEININGPRVDETNCLQIAQIVNQSPNLVKLNISGPFVCSTVAALTNLPASLGLTMPAFTNEDFDLIVPKFNALRGDGIDCRLMAEEWEPSIDPLHRFLRKVQFSAVSFRSIQPTAIAWDGEYWAQRCTRQVRQRMQRNQEFLNLLKSGRLTSIPPELRREVYLKEVGPWTIDFSDYSSHSKYATSSDDEL